MARRSVTLGQRGTGSRPELVIVADASYEGQIGEPDLLQIIAYIKSLGVTTVELLPVHTFIDDSFLLEKYQAGMISQHEVITKAQDPTSILAKLQEMEAAKAAPGRRTPRRAHYIGRLVM